MDAATELNEVRVDVDDHSSVGAARRQGMSYAQAAGADELTTAKLGIVVTELATNLVRHAKGGALLVRTVSVPDGEALEVLATDHGPGIAHPSRCLSDGHSTQGSPGTGLGAVKRLSDVFDLFTLRARGTVVLSRILLHARPASPAGHVHRGIDWGYAAQEAPSETCNGDACAIATTPDSIGLLVADGLGHGPLAARASNMAADLFRDSACSLVDFIDSAHALLNRTRGAAVAACRVDLVRRRVNYVGVGNIAGTLISDQRAQGLLTQNGTVGQYKPRLQVMEYDWPREGLLVMHSDGIRGQWHMDDYPGLQQRHPAIVAATLARDHRRGTDDSLILVLGGRDTAATTRQ